LSFIVLLPFLDAFQLDPPVHERVRDHVAMTHLLDFEELNVARPWRPPDPPDTLVLDCGAEPCVQSAHRGHEKGGRNKLTLEELRCKVDADVAIPLHAAAGLNILRDLDGVKLLDAL
jgi:hypothetical protein